MRAKVRVCSLYGFITTCVKYYSYGGNISSCTSTSWNLSQCHSNSSLSWYTVHQHEESLDALSKWCQLMNEVLGSKYAMWQYIQYTVYQMVSHSFCTFRTSTVATWIPWKTCKKKKKKKSTLNLAATVCIFVNSSFSNSFSIS